MAFYYHITGRTVESLDNTNIPPDSRFSPGESRGHHARLDVHGPTTFQDAFLNSIL